MRAGSLLAAAAIALAGVADAAVRRTSGLHDARYCEIIELKGAPPRARAVVWNSIKLNRCLAAQWNALDAGALAKELGDTLVIKNGPRHFLMDSASARTGRVRSFQGIRMRREATIPIRSPRTLSPPLQRPDHQPPQHLALEARPARV